jgi:hypothetical protein
LADRQFGDILMSMTLVAIVKRQSWVDLKYGETANDPEPFTLTITPQYVAQQTSKSLPLTGVELQAFLIANVSKLQATAEDCKARGLTSEVLS